MWPNDVDSMAADILTEETGEGWPEIWRQLINRLRFRGAFQPADGAQQVVAKTKEFVDLARREAPTVGLAQLTDILHRRFSILDGAMESLVLTDQANVARSIERVL